MNIKQDVIIDLLPLYFEGNASKETINLIEGYFVAHPEFADSMKQMQDEDKLDSKTLEPDLIPEQKLQILKKTQRILKWRTAFFIMGMVGLIVPFLVSNFQQPDWVSSHFVISWLVATPLVWIGYFVIRYMMRTNNK